MTMNSGLRSISRVVRLPAAEPGFAGEGHTAVEVVRPDDLLASDPFVLLMDDRLDFAPGSQIGGAHPHAGLETVTLVLDGSLEDRDEGELSAGDAVWMTAGRGVIHSEDIRAGGPSRVLQLWVTLPERARAAEPRLDVLKLAEVPVFRGAGIEARVYSGSSNGVSSNTMNHVPVTLVDVRLAGGAVFEQELAASYNGFILPLAGAVRVGERTVREGELAWLDRRDGDGPTTLRIETEKDARVVLYLGERQNEPTVQRGPFVAGSMAAIEGMYRAFRAGRFVPISQLAR